MAKSQNKPTNHMKTKILLQLMALALLLAACGKNEQSAGKTATKGKTAAGRVISDTSDFIPDDVFSIARNGERVTIRWDYDFSSYNGIRILRNTTGVAKDKQVVAYLPASSKEYVDTVPAAHAYWYWISLGLGGHKSKIIGPLRARTDAGKTGNYTDVSQKIEFSAQRTQSSVVVAWDLPEGKYKSVSIKRNNKPSFAPGTHRANVHTTKEWRGDIVDKLPDPNVDYWYWVDATREDGSVISKGPVKAEFEGAANAATPASAPKAKAKGKGTGKGPAKGKGGKGGNGTGIGNDIFN